LTQLSGNKHRQARDVGKSKIETMSEEHEWVERIGKTAYAMCNDPTRNRIKLNEQHTGFIMEFNDAAGLGYLGWAIEQHLNNIPTKLKPTFQQILKKIIKMLLA
jgi:hypothetical protein